MTTALEGGEGSASRPGRSLPPGKTRYPLHRRLGWPQGRSGQVRKNSTPPGFDPRTLQPVASRYTDCLLLVYLMIKSLLNSYKVPLPIIDINMSMFSYLRVQPEQHLLAENRDVWIVSEQSKDNMCLH